MPTLPDSLRAAALLGAFGLFVVLPLYTPLGVAPAIAGAMRNQVDIDASQSGLYRNVYVSTAGLFVLSLYVTGCKFINPSFNTKDN
jgi:hypothetical protein